MIDETDYVILQTGGNDCGPDGWVQFQSCAYCYRDITAHNAPLGLAMERHLSGCKAAIAQPQIDELVALAQAPWWKLGGWRFKRRQKQMRAAAGMPF